MRKLTPKERAFVAHYLVHLNGALAVREAGYKTKRPDQQAYELLRKPEIQTAIQQAMDARSKRVDLKADRVLEEIAHAAFLDPIELFADDGTLKPLKDMPEHARRSIAGLEVVELFDGTGKNRTWIGYLKKVKLVSKEGTLELAGRHLKLFTDKTEVSGPDGGPVTLNIQPVKAANDDSLIGNSPEVRTIPGKTPDEH